MAASDVKDDYEDLLRRCFIKAVSGKKLPPSEDPQRTAFIKEVQKNNTTFAVYLTGGLPLLYLFNTRVLRPRFTIHRHLRLSVFFLTGIAYSICVTWLCHSNESTELLTQLAWKEESLMKDLCPPVKNFRWKEDSESKGRVIRASRAYKWLARSRKLRGSQLPHT